MTSEYNGNYSALFISTEKEKKVVYYLNHVFAFIDFKIEQLHCSQVLILLNNFLWGGIEIKSVQV